MATYQRGKYWWYRFRFAGERIDEPTKSTSRTVAKEAERQHRRALESGYNNFKEVRQNRVRILEEIIDDYLTGYRLRYRSATFAEYALGHVRRLLGTKIVADITDISVLRYQEDRLREKAAPKSINEEVRFYQPSQGPAPCRFDRHHARGIEAESHLEQVPEAAQQKSSSDHQHQGTSPESIPDPGPLTICQGWRFRVAVYSQTLSDVSNDLLSNCRSSNICLRRAHPFGEPVDSVLITVMTPLENFRLTVFRKVAEQLSFRKAAEDLYLTQPAVSLQIKALEEEIGVALFDRRGPRIGLTAAGTALLQYAEQSSRLLSEARHAVAAFSGTQSGTLTLGASTTIAQYVLPRLLSEFCAAHPRVKPTLTSGNTEEIVTAVEEERVALGFIEGPPHSRDLTLTPFFEDELVLLVSLSHEWAERGEIAPEELIEAPILMRERGSGTRNIIELALEHHHIRRGSLNVVMELDSTEAIKSSVEAGFGVGFVSRWALSKDARFESAFRILKVKGMRIRRHFDLIARKTPDLSGAAAEFRSFVLENAARKHANPVAGAQRDGR